MQLEWEHLGRSAGGCKFEVRPSPGGLIEIRDREAVQRAGERVFGSTFTVLSVWSICRFTVQCADSHESVIAKLPDFVRELSAIATILMTNLISPKEEPG